MCNFGAFGANRKCIFRLCAFAPGVGLLHGEAAAGRRLGAGQEAEQVLHVEGGDGHVAWRREVITGR